MGEIDRAAKEEMKHDRKFQYYTYDTTCLVENDEEPPAPLNEEALSVCLTIAKMFAMTPVPNRCMSCENSSSTVPIRAASSAPRSSQSTGRSRTAG